MALVALLCGCGSRGSAPPDAFVDLVVDGAALAPDAGIDAAVPDAKPTDAPVVFDAAPVIDATVVFDASFDARPAIDAMPMIDAVPKIDASAVCLSVGPYGDFPSCTACTMAGLGCNEIDINGSVDYHCDCGSGCPCGLRCGSREIAPNVFVSNICVR
jgi:hypothetical protein